jgi:hypothetical protein
MLLLLTVRGLSAWLNMKPSTLYLWVAQGKIPCRKIHGFIRFDPDTITAWLRSFEPGQAKAVPTLTRQPHRDLDRLIEAAKRDASTPRHGETITPSPTVLPDLISGQFVEHCKLSFLQRIQPASSPHFLRDIQAHSLVTLVRDLWLSSTAMGLE